MLSWFQCLALSLLAVALLPLARGDDLVAPDDFRIGVASCNNERVRTTLWSVLRERKPQVTALLGDNIYADHPLFLKVRIPATLDDIRRSYARLGRQPDFTALREETDLQATWDDHDFGKNDADKTWSLKEESRQLFLSFFKEPRDSPRWHQPGVYTSVTHTLAGLRVRLILLDNRYNLDPLPGNRKSRPDEPQDMLGPEQWRWLEDLLTKEHADVNLIGTGLQVIANDKASMGETYNKHPASQAKLLALLAKTRTAGVVLLSGDVHMAEMNRVQCGFFYPLYELTSSGITHSWSGAREIAVRLVSSGYRRLGPIYTGRNVGEVAVRGANTSTSEIVLRVFNRKGKTVLERAVPLASLSPTDLAPYASDVAACAASNPHDGLDDACSRLLASCTPIPTAQQLKIAQFRVGILASGSLFIMITALGAPCLLACGRPRSARLRYAVGVVWIAVVAFLVALIRSG